jgi:arylsulfatase A-like enzyme
MVRLPDGTGAGERFDQWVYDIDLTATALDALGEDPLPEMDGRSLLPIITGEQDELHDYAICGYSNVHCVWQDDFIYVRDVDADTEGLYNAWEDPEQQNDLAAQMPERRAEMAARLYELVAKGYH